MVESNENEPCDSGLWFGIYGLYNNLWTIFPKNFHCGLAAAGLGYNSFKCLGPDIALDTRN